MKACTQVLSRMVRWNHLQSQIQESKLAPTRTQYEPNLGGRRQTSFLPPDRDVGIQDLQHAPQSFTTKLWSRYILFATSGWVECTEADPTQLCCTLAVRPRLPMWRLIPNISPGNYCDWSAAPSLRPLPPKWRHRLCHHLLCSGRAHRITASRRARYNDNEKDLTAGTCCKTCSGQFVHFCTAH